MGETVDFLSLVRFKDRGELIYPSPNVKIIRVCEIVFRANISGDKFNAPNEISW